MQIAKDKVVMINYKLTDPDGQVLDSSEGRDPLAYLHGRGNIIPGLETALDGKSAGEQVQVTVEPAQAYGEKDDNLVQQVPLSKFEGVDKIEPGMQFTAQTQMGPRVISVTAVDEANDMVTVDANHPLAGVTLNFDVNIVEVREATAEELDHGHVHGPGGHHH
ncbi:peptidylprolyl isomerase [Planctomycetales bacterium ZRK34]|nr:peptidylprolyl isomerase [Planctomycetales bacterium ZRK34]